jgi:hypothetical protein
MHPRIKPGAKGDARTLELGCKVSIETPITQSNGDRLCSTLGAERQSFEGHTLGSAVADIDRMTCMRSNAVTPKRATAATTTLKADRQVNRNLKGREGDRIKFDLRCRFLQLQPAAPQVGGALTRLDPVDHRRTRSRHDPSIKLA